MNLRNIEDSIYLKRGQRLHEKLWHSCSVYGQNEGLQSCFMSTFGALQSRLDCCCVPLSNPPARQTLFPKGSPRWHSYVWVCFLFPCTRLRGKGVTWRFIPRGCHDNYSCQAVIKDTTHFVSVTSAGAPHNLWSLYTHQPTCALIHTLTEKQAYIFATQKWTERASWLHVCGEVQGGWISCVYVTEVYSGYQASPGQSGAWSLFFPLQLETEEAKNFLIATEHILTGLSRAAD